MIKAIREWGEALIIAIVLALFIRAFFLQAFKIPSGSMLETLQIGDQLLVNKILYGVKIPFTDILLINFSDPKHNDVIVFEYPKDPSKDYIKRVIGVPGDTIEIRDKELYRNGEKIEESYIQHKDPRIKKRPEDPNSLALAKEQEFLAEGGMYEKYFDSGFTWIRDNFGPITVPENHYFVMGDNRDSSQDSRYWGFVHRNKVVGKAWILYWSWKSFSDIRWSRIGNLVR